MGGAGEHGESLSASLLSDDEHELEWERGSQRIGVFRC